MFINQNTYSSVYEHKCSSCGKGIIYSLNNVFINNKFVPKIGWKTLMFCKCDKCGHLEKISE